MKQILIVILIFSFNITFAGWQGLNKGDASNLFALTEKRKNQGLETALTIVLLRVGGTSQFNRGLGRDFHEIFVS